MRVEDLHQKHTLIESDIHVVGERHIETVCGGERKFSKMEGEKGKEFSRDSSAKLEVNNESKKQ